MQNKSDDSNLDDTLREHMEEDAESQQIQKDEIEQVWSSNWKQRFELILKMNLDDCLDTAKYKISNTNPEKDSAIFISIEYVWEQTTRFEAYQWYRLIIIIILRII